MKKTLWNLFTVLLLAVALAATQIPVEDLEASAASDFQMDGTTLVKYIGTDSTVSIPASVEIIGEEAFRENDTATIVQIPSSVTKISNGAFSNCGQLKRVEIGSGVEEIQEGAFANCKALNSVIFGENIRTLGAGVFAGCTSLSSVSVSNKNTWFVCQSGVLYDDEKTTIYQYLAGRNESIYDMPSSVTKIRNYAFWGSENLQNVALGDNLKEIAPYAFSNCKNLKEVKISYAVNTIGQKAFEDCVNLETVVFPESVEYIHPSAFDGCRKLVIEATEGTAAANFAETYENAKDYQAEYEDMGIYSNTQGVQNNNNTQESQGETASDSSQGSSNNGTQGSSSSVIQGPSEGSQVITGANENTGTLQNTTLLGSTSIIGNKAVIFIDNTKQTVNTGGDANEQEADNQDVLSVVGEAAINSGRAVIEAGEGTLSSVSENTPRTALSGIAAVEALNINDEKGGSLPKYTVVNDTIADQAYYQNQDLKEFSFPQGITEIGEFSFARSGLEIIRIPVGVTKIGYGAFYHCDDLKTVSIPGTVREIEPMAFEGTAWIEVWRESGSSNFLTVGDGVLLAYNGSDSVVNIPQGVKRIAPEVFKDHAEITDVYLPDSLIIIGEGAFENCNSLTSVSGGTQMQEIRDRAFAGCPIDTIRIPESVTQIGLRAFDYIGISKDSGQKVVVFHGSTIPKGSYERTATRLSNEDYRDLNLREVSIAVVPNETGKEDLEGSVLDTGFKGIICHMNDNQTLSCLTTTLTGEELAYFVIPDTVEVYDKQYPLIGKEILQEEAANNDENTLLGEGSILVQNKAAAIAGQTLRASLEGNGGDYLLMVQDRARAESAINSAYQEFYNEELPENTLFLDFILEEQNSGVLIHKLGKQSMEVTLPVDGELAGGRLRILTTDRNGQLEEIAYRKDVVQDQNVVVFVTNHFSQYAFYSIGNQVYGENTEMDASPDTGDLSIHPKWFIAAGFLFAAIACFFARKKVRRFS